MKIFDWITSFFVKEEKQQYPYAFLKVELNNVAKSNGIVDDYNLVIKKYVNGEVVEEHPYTKQLLNSMKEVEELPVFYENYNSQEDEFEFFPFEDLSVAKYRRRRGE